MTDSITVMNNLLKRVIPENIEEIIEYYDAVSLFDRPSISFKALLLVNIENFNGAADTIKWGIERSNKSRSYISHLLRIGRVLINIDNDVFGIIRDFSYDKYLEILTLPVDDIPKFILSRGKKLTGMTRDEIREEVYKVLGKELKISPKKDSKYQPTLWDGVGILLEKDDHDFEEMAMSEGFNDNSACKFAISGLGLLTASKSYWRAHGVKDSKTLATIEKQLRDEADALAEIRENNTASLLVG